LVINHYRHHRARYVRAVLVADDEGATGHYEQIRRGIHSHGAAAEVSRRLRADADQRGCVGVQRI